MVASEGIYGAKTKEKATTNAQPLKKIALRFPLQFRLKTKHHTKKEGMELTEEARKKRQETYHWTKNNMKMVT